MDLELFIFLISNEILVFYNNWNLWHGLHCDIQIISFAYPSAIANNIGNLFCEKTGNGYLIRLIIRKNKAIVIIILKCFCIK